MYLPISYMYHCFEHYIGFKYFKALKVATSVTLPANATGCKCKGSCTDPTTCECAKRNGSEFPYVSRDGGRLETLVKCYLNHVCCNNNNVIFNTLTD